METESPELIDNEVSLEIDAADIQPPAKRRRKKSMVWNHFTTEKTGPESARAFCKHCNKSYAYKTGAKTAGTSHLKRHIVLGICQKCPKMDDLPPVKKRQRYSSADVSLDLSHRCNREIAKMIIMHDYPLHMVHHSGFAGFVHTLHPQFTIATFDTIHHDCLTMFLSEKDKLLLFIGNIPGAVNLTVDLWLSNQSVGYALVTAYFVDKDWNLTRLLLNVSVVPCPDTDTALNQPVAACLSDWKLEGKISSIAVSQSVPNKTSIDNLRGFLSVRNQHVLNEQLLMGKCYARVLSSMALDVLTAEQLQPPIKKLRDSIKFIKTNDTCGDKFEELKKRLNPTLSSKELLIDNQRRWDTSYNMLLAACEHREVFSYLQCRPEYKISISPEEWTKIENLCSCLKVLYEACNVLTGPSLLTSSDLFNEMTNLQQGLNHAATCEDLEVRDLANQLREKFDLYWRGCYLVLAVAVVLDPRAKMEHITLTFKNSYGENAEEWTKTVDEAVHDLYISYSEQNLNLLDAYVDNGTSEIEMAQEPHLHEDPPQDVNTGNSEPVDETSPKVEQTTESHQHEGELSVEKQDVEGPGEGASEERQLTEEDQQLGDDSQANVIEEEGISPFPVDTLLEEGATLVTIGDSLSDFEIYIQDLSDLKTELESYLELSSIPRCGDFNILRWWKDNSVNYPILSKMAVDILTVPFCTVSPDSVFDTEVKQMDDYRTSLPQATLEALLCTKDWFKNKTW